MISLSISGSTKNLEAFLQKQKTMDLRSRLAPHGAAGVAALSRATPSETGMAARSWDYRVETSGRSVKIVWFNTDVESGFPVAIALQYGYATGTGGYVQGRDYINPAMRPLFDQIANDVWKEVTSG